MSGGPSSYHPEWLGRHHKARHHVVSWIERVVPLAGATVLEYGCGQGAIACAVAPRVKRHIGLDIDRGEVDLARGHVDRRGLANVELIDAPVEEILDRVAGFAGEVDVFLLYAVLEHLTLDERLAVLALAREVVRPEGHIVVCESPNRLTPLDHHTGQMPFLHALPLELEARYYGRSTRRDFVDAVDAASRCGPEALREALVRWGTGVSFHDFELAFDDLPAHVVASNFAADLYPVRPVRKEELDLCATLDAWRPDLPPCFCRSWLDLILSARPQAEPAVHVRPWAPELPDGVAGAAMHADGRIALAPGAWLPVRLPVVTDELHVGLMGPDPAGALRVRVPEGELAPRAVGNLDDVPPWHATVRLAVPTDTVELALAGGGHITYVGYRGAADPHAAAGRGGGW